MGFHRTIVHIPPKTDGTLGRMVDAWTEPQFFRVSVISPMRAPEASHVAKRRLASVCFCGRPCSGGRCTTCGWETPWFRAHKLLLRDPEDLAIELALSESLAQQES